MGGWGRTVVGPVAGPVWWSVCQLAGPRWSVTVCMTTQPDAQDPDDWFSDLFDLGKIQSLSGPAVAIGSYCIRP